MMALADHALYVATLGAIGIVPLAVTTSFSINFLRKPPAGGDVTAECRLIEVGRVLVVGDVMIYSDGQDQPVAHATGTYSVPPLC
jgi:acyl-coenzyme A thioesterase PaaI-like protein